MIVVCSDSHAREGHSLPPAMLDAVEDADRVVHAGDFVTEAVVDAFHDASNRLEAVHGNADSPGVRERLPAARTVDWEGARIAVKHRPEGGTTGLTMFGRQRGADLVVHGHTHVPRFVSGEAGPAVCNPGSYNDPRGNRPGYAELRRDGTDLVVAMNDLDGTTVDRHRITVD